MRFIGQRNAFCHSGCRLISILSGLLQLIAFCRQCPVDAQEAKRVIVVQCPSRTCSASVGWGRRPSKPRERAETTNPTGEHCPPRNQPTMLGCQWQPNIIICACLYNKDANFSSCCLWDAKKGVDVGQKGGTFPLFSRPRFLLLFFKRKFTWNMMESRIIH